VPKRPLPVVLVALDEFGVLVEEGVHEPALVIARLATNSPRGDVCGRRGTSVAEEYDEAIETECRPTVSQRGLHA
jgi:hypothetical protein